MIYKKEKITLLQCDCMEYMLTIPDNYYDLAIVDPPYGINQGGDKNHTRGKLAAAKKYRSFDDSKPPEQAYFNELKRISKNQIIWGGNYFIEKINKNSSCWIVWDKVNGNTDFADCELAWTSFETAVRIFKFRWQGMLQGDMKNKEVRINPTQKPVKLYDWLLLNYAKPDFKIIDTHGGSFSSAIAAYYFGCEFTGIEIDKDSFNDAVKRFKEKTLAIGIDFKENFNLKSIL